MSATSHDYKYARLAATIRTLRQECREHGQLDPILLDYGDMISPYVFTRYLLSQPQGMDQLNTLITSLDYDLVCPGNREFDVSPKVLSRIFDRYHAAGMMVLASNVQHGEQAGTELYQALNRDPVSGLITPFHIVHRQGLKLGFISLLPEDLARNVAIDRLTGLQVRTIHDTLSDLISRLRREEQIDALILVSHLETGATFPRQVLQLIQDNEGIDLVISNEFDQYNNPATSLKSIHFATHKTVICGIPAEGVAVGQAVLTFERSDDTTVLRNVEPKTVLCSEFEPDKTVSEILDTIRANYCQSWQKPLGHGRLESDMSRDDYVNYLLEIARTMGRTEIALINTKGIYYPPVFPISGVITRDAIYQTMPFDNHLFRFELSGKELLELAPRLASASENNFGKTIVARGFDGQKVNGRSIDLATLYSVVSTDFIVQGGDGHLVPDKISPRIVTWPKTNESMTFRDIVLRYFEQDLYADGHSGKTIDLSTNFPDLWEKALWKLMANVQGEYSENSKNSNAHYYAGSDRPQLTSADIRSQLVAVDISLAADARNYNWDNKLQTLYSKSKLDQDPEKETLDRIFFESTYTLRYFMNRYSRDDWVKALYPLPYASLSLETEWTLGQQDSSLDKEPAYRHMQLTTTAGIRFELLPKLAFKVGAGSQKELDKPGATAQNVIELGYELKKTALFFAPELPVFLESRFDYLRRTGGDDGTEMFWQNKILFNVFKNLSFYLGFNRFFFRTDEHDQWGIADELKVGIDLTIAKRHHFF